MTEIHLDGPSRDDFSQATKETLAKRAGQRCSNPDCRCITSGPHEDATKAVNIGVAAHITAAAPGGPRYNKDLSSEERSSIGNAIWLCQNCAKLIDSDAQTYPEEALIIWKRCHEGLIKAQISGAGGGTATAAILNISAIYQHTTNDAHSTILDFRVSNQGGSDLMINAVELQTLASMQKMLLGHAQYSKKYDLDIGSLKEYSSRAECQVAQILKPGEADRFAIVLSAPSLNGTVACWRFTTTFKTNFGPVIGPEIEVWLPAQKADASHKIPTLAEIAQLLADKAKEQMTVHKPTWDRSEIEDVNNLAAFGKFLEGGGGMISRPAKTAGFETYVIVGVWIGWLYGPKPLI